MAQEGKSRGWVGAGWRQGMYERIKVRERGGSPHRARLAKRRARRALGHVHFKEWGNGSGICWKGQPGTAGRSGQAVPLETNKHAQGNGGTRAGGRGGIAEYGGLGQAGCDKHNRHPSL